MKSTLRAFGVTAALATTALVSGCGSTTAGTAAVVDGHRITEDEVASAVKDLEVVAAAQQQEPPTLTQVLTFLVAAPSIIAAGDAAGIDQPAAAVESQLRTQADEVSDSTVTFARAVTIFQGLSSEQRDGMLDSLRKSSVSVNPRYGTWSSTDPGLQAAVPSWISDSE